MKHSTVLIIDHSEGNNLRERIEKWQGFEVVGSTNNPDIGFTLAERHQPAVIMLNVDMPGSEENPLAELFALEFPASSLILMTGSDSKRVLRQALRVGAKDVINLPIEDDKLLRLISKVLQYENKRQQVYTVQKKDRPQFKTITVFSTKGGVGKSTVALNLALALKKLTNKRVVLVDLNFASGTIALMAGINARRSIKDVVDEMNNLDEELLESYCEDHPSGLKVIPAPSDPSVAEFIKAEHVEKILDRLSKNFNYVVIDAPNNFQDSILPALEKSRDILVVTTLDLASIYNLKQCLEMLTGLNMRTKARVIVNKLGYSGGLKVKDLEDQLATSVQCVLPNCEKLAVNAVNMGIPLFLAGNKSPLNRPLTEMAQKLMVEDDQPRDMLAKRSLLKIGR